MYICDYIFCRVVEFATLSDMKNALDKLDDTELNGRRIRLVEDRRHSRRSRSSSSRSRSRSRSRRRSHTRSRYQIMQYCYTLDIDLYLFQRLLGLYSLFLRYHCSSQILQFPTSKPHLIKIICLHQNFYQPLLLEHLYAMSFQSPSSVSSDGIHFHIFLDQCVSSIQSK